MQHAVSTKTPPPPLDMGDGQKKKSFSQGKTSFSFWSFAPDRAAKYGDTADECGEALFLCGKSLLELARLVDGLGITLPNSGSQIWLCCDAELHCCVGVGWRTLSLVTPWRESQKSPKGRSSSSSSPPTPESRAPITLTVKYIVFLVSDS